MELVNLVDAGEIDMAAIIRPPFSLQSDLRWTTLALEPYRLIVPSDVQEKIGQNYFPANRSFGMTGHPSGADRWIASFDRCISPCVRFASWMN